ncbi:Rieske 2Fe-2S domain-containing protein [Sphingomonas histidinilytica]|uniref:Phenylpropionate dioxygenase, large terminal subunit n=1 Tax=Rhizorhabdus histidinilytica TaxID=439228 RepID=A0A1T5FXD6_9SPHN|nr:aromatic ring-hydroxylating dioxygenase subunit alpha [Rhizorhabdus histidinilytica]MBO9375863.1 Rieske 2Fe-2S domain-containing protein [Rhizorhabdus histidinilytica]QEH81374.1 aromatic ring-hydroxylating dioxygenase subunit alpha [Sphingomonas sp. C8-2]SKC00714.1 Phenylpropionate dioxygenase, large terminal subunit [Rhizorhabdus histidinilytica]
MNYDFRLWDIHVGAPHPFYRHSYVDNGTARPTPARYHDPAFAAEEWEKVFARSWLVACPVSDIREPGDFARFDIGRESFIVVRGDDGEVHAHYNVCPHRGSRLVLDDFGSQSAFTCPFHSWRFDLDGKNVAVTDPETFRPEVLCHDINMTSVRCEVAAGLVFISMDPDIVPVKEWLAPILPQLELYDIDKMHVIQHRRSDWGANWKGGVDAFAEIYHLHAVHPQTQCLMDDRTQIDLYPGGLSRQFVPFAQPSPRFADQESVNPGIALMLRDAGIDPATYGGTAKETRAAVQAAKRKRAADHGLDYDKFSDSQLSDSTVYSLFPNAQIGCHPEAVFLHRFLPHASDPNQFTYDTMILYRHVDAPGYTPPAWMGLSEDIDTSGETRPDVVHTGLGEPPGLGEVLDQDSDLLPIVQAGARSRGFRGPLWSEQEGRLRHFHAELDRRMGLGEPA